MKKHIPFLFWGLALVSILTVSVLHVRGDLDRKTTSVDQIKFWYEKYKIDEKLLDAYLDGLSDGFKMGVHGQPAHIALGGAEGTPLAASMNGFAAGYSYGLELYRSLSGNPIGYRKKKS